MMKVYKMNECDHVAAHSEKEAKEYYFTFDGTMDEINGNFEGEVSLDDEMYVDFDDLPEEEKGFVQKMKLIGGQLWVLKPFRWVLENDKKDEPYIICSTEY